jgi:hypothetical protein
MPKTAFDPLFATSIEPISAARKAAVVTPNDAADLSNVTSSLLVTVGSGGTGISVIFANDGDQNAVTIPLAPGSSYQLSMQIRRVMATNTNLGTGGGVTALWS